MRWALAISPVNYPLFFMHLSNVAAQLNEATRHYRYTYYQSKKIDGSC